MRSRIRNFLEPLRLEIVTVFLSDATVDIGRPFWKQNVGLGPDYDRLADMIAAKSARYSVARLDVILLSGIRRTMLLLNPEAQDEFVCEDTEG